MKNFILIFSIACLSAVPAHAQLDMGLTLSPAISANRVEAEPAAGSVGSGGANLKISVGAFADFFLKENYYFSSGLYLTSKHVGLEYRDAGGAALEETYRIQYLQIPLTFKLYTNEVALDKRIFAQFGLLNEVRVDVKEKEGTGEVIQDFNLFDFSLMIRAALDFRVGYNTSVFGGIGYVRGLTNVVDEHSALVNDLKVKNDMVTIDFGVKF